MRNLYTKTKAKTKVKVGSMLSPLIENNMGVNQGGVLSPFLFRKFLQDLCQYFENEDGINLGEEILMYLLWADDLVMLAETAEGLQRQIERLARYCLRNQLIINALKTKIVIFGKKSGPSEFHVHGNPIEIVHSYKYLGVLFSSCTTLVGNPFKNNFQYLADNAGKAIHSIYSSSNILGRFPVHTSFALFDSLVKPILEYGSEIWGGGGDWIT